MDADAPTRDPIVRLARSLSVRGVAIALTCAGTVLLALAVWRIASGTGPSPWAWVRLSCAATWIAVGTWVLVSTGRRRRDWRARGRAPIIVMLTTLVIAPIGVSGHPDRGAVDLLEIVIGGPLLGLCVLLDGLLLRESVVTVDDLDVPGGDDA